MQKNQFITMGTIGNIFESGGQKALQGHFRNLVMIARVDGKIDPEEVVLLTRMARRLSLTDAQVTEICENVEHYPIMPPVSKEDRLERFIRLVQMVMINGKVSNEERKLAIKYGVELGIDESKVDQLFDTIMHLWLNGMDASEILDEISK